MRICPQCREQTEDTQCPNDGFSTVPLRFYSSVEPPDPLVGQVFEGRYRVEALLGRGGFGSVYRAIQLAISGRPVALKVLRRDLAQSLEQVGRFQREAHAASRLMHPNTIRVIDFGQTEQGDLFLVTELLLGEPLSRVMRRERCLPVDRTVHIVSQVCKSLAEAHDAGIVHRDIKPDNIFLHEVRGETDLVKVLDFGVAKLAATEGSPSSLTQTGAVVGSPAYMAPEQALGKRVDGRTDLYAVGVVLYEMLGGRLPFLSEQILELLTAHVVSPVPPLRNLVDVPAALSDLVHECLAKDPDDRPASADELRERLEAVVGAPQRRQSTPAAMQHELGAATITDLRVPVDETNETLAGTPVDTPPSSGILTSADIEAVVRRRRWRRILVGATGVALLVGVAIAIPWGGSGGPKDATMPSGAGAEAGASATGPAIAADADAPPDDPGKSTGADAPPVPVVAVEAAREPVVYRIAEETASVKTRRALETQWTRAEEPKREPPKKKNRDRPPKKRGNVTLEVEYQ